MAVAWIRMNARRFRRLNKMLREIGFSKYRCKTFLSYTQSFLEYAKKQPEDVTEEAIMGYIARYPANVHLKSYLKFYYTEILGKSLISLNALQKPHAESKAPEEHTQNLSEASFSISNNTISNVANPQFATALSDKQDKLAKFEREMEIRSYKKSTIENYLRYTKEFIEFIKKPSEDIKEEDIIKYLDRLKLSKGDVKSILHSLRLFYATILGKNISTLKGRYGYMFKEPVVLNRDEVIKRFEPQQIRVIDLNENHSRFICRKLNMPVTMCRMESCELYKKCSISIITTPPQAPMIQV